MIPSFAGRLQTRLLLFVLVGLPVTALYAYLVQDRFAGRGDYLGALTLFTLFLTTITVLGLVLDRVYIFIQSLRWDRDWPFAYQLAFSVMEFGIVLWLAAEGLLPWLPDWAFDDPVELRLAAGHFAAVLVPSFLALLGPLQVLFLRWRFNSGRIGRF